ncbi:MAG: DUF2029 domain-containing protein [Chloroflexi bacterium]|nr:DUF2029 domain-containing protein [Chloroflexota bacterium]
MSNTVLKKQQLYRLIGAWIGLIGLIWLGWNQTSHYWFDLGSVADQDGLTGFNERETNEFFSYRWTQEKAQIAVPFQHGPTALTFNGTIHPNAQQVQLNLGDQHLITLDPQKHIDLAMRRYHVYIPEQRDPWGHLKINIDSIIPQVSADGRKLGLLFDLFEIKNLAAPWGLPPLGFLIVSCLLPGLWFWLLIQLFPRHMLLASGLSFLSIFSIIGLWIWRAPLIEPQLVSLAIGSFVLAAFVAWLNYLYRSALIPIQKVILLMFGASSIISGYLLYFYGFTDWLTWWNLGTITGIAVLLLPIIPQKYHKILWSITAICIIGYGILNYMYVFERDYADDFKALFRGPRAYIQGIGLYDFEAIAANPFSNTYKYPPFFVFFMAPFTSLTFTPAIQSWRAFNIVIMLIASVILMRGYQQHWRSWVAIGLGFMLLVFQPINDSLRYGQVDMLMLLPLVIATIALLKERWNWFAAMIAIPTMLKLYPAYLLAQVAMTKRWRAGLAFMATCLGIIVLSVIVLGWDVHAQFIQHVLPTTSGGTGWVENQTWNGWLNRLINPTIGLTPDTSTTVKLLTYAMALGLSGLTWWFSRKMSAADGFGLWIITMLMILPSTWIHYQVLLIIPVFQLLVRVQQTKQLPSWSIFGLYGLALVSLSIGNQWTFYDRGYHGVFWALLLSYKLYGLIALWWAVAFDSTARIANPKSSPSQNLG